VAQQLTMQDLVDYKAFLELQNDKFVLDPKAEKKKAMKRKIRMQAEIEAKKAKAKK